MASSPLPSRRAAATARASARSAGRAPRSSVLVERRARRRQQHGVARPRELAPRARRPLSIVPHALDRGRARRARARSSRAASPIVRTARAFARDERPRAPRSRRACPGRPGSGARSPAHTLERLRRRVHVGALRVVDPAHAAAPRRRAGCGAAAPRSASAPSTMAASGGAARHSAAASAASAFSRLCAPGSASARPRSTTAWRGPATSATSDAVLEPRRRRRPGRPRREKRDAPRGVVDGRRDGGSSALTTATSSGVCRAKTRALAARVRLEVPVPVEVVRRDVRQDRDVRRGTGPPSRAGTTTPRRRSRAARAPARNARKRRADVARERDRPAGAPQDRRRSRSSSSTCRWCR